LKTTNKFENPSLMNAVLSALPEPIFLYDEEGRYLDVLGGCDRSRYYDPSGLIGKKMHDVMSKEKADAFLYQINNALELNKVISYEYTLKAEHIMGQPELSGPDGLMYSKAYVSPVHHTDDSGKKVVWMTQNITSLRVALKKQKEQENILKEMVTKDSLTGLYNRKSLYDVSEREVERCIRKDRDDLSVIMLDLDHFKKVNDSFGHAAGDEVLKVFSKTLIESCRINDSISRVGGEEFAILLPDTTLDSAFVVAERVRYAVENLKVIHGTSVIIFTTSIGLSSLQKGDSDIKDAMERADKALYQSKGSGRNKVSIYGRN